MLLLFLTFSGLATILTWFLIMSGMYVASGFEPVGNSVILFKWTAALSLLLGLIANYLLAIREVCKE